MTGREYQTEQQPEAVLFGECSSCFNALERPFWDSICFDCQDALDDLDDMDGFDE